MEEKLKKIIFVFYLCFIYTPAYSEEKLQQFSGIKSDEQIEAPFGLKWGTSVADAEAMNLKINKIESKNEGNFYLVNNLSKSLIDIDRVYLNFGYNNKLWLIVAVSKNFENDPYGNQVLARYNELSNLLEIKYGKPESSHFLDNKMYKSKDEFIAGIYNGRSHYFSDFNKQGISVQLSLGANSYSSAFFKLRYENIELSNEFKKDKNHNESGAL